MKQISEFNMLLISGNAHPVLANSIANELETTLVNAKIGSHPDGETDVEIYEDVRGEDLFVVQPTGPPVNQNIMESLIIIDALRRASAGRITVVDPYYGYSRSDRKDKSRKPIVGKLKTNLYEKAGADRLLSIDLHAHQIQGFTDLPFDHLYAAKILAEQVSQEIINPVIVAPDIGAGKMARGFARRMGSDWAIIDKERTNGTETEVVAMFGQSVVGREVLLIDDIASTLGTIINSADALKEQGAEHIYAVATHGVLCGNAIERLNESQTLERLWVTDTLPPVDKPSDKISRITIAPLLAKAILNIHQHKSVTELF